MNLPIHVILKRYPNLRESIRKVLTGISTHRPASKPDIMMFSSRRSGSTLLAEAIGAEPGLRYINEPFGPKYLHRTLLKDLSEHQDFLLENKVLSLEKAMEEPVIKYITDPKQTQLCGPYNPAKKNFHWRTNRRIFKIIHCNPIIEHFMNEFAHFKFFFLARHPMPTILSLKKSYGLQIGLYLENSNFCKQHLNDEKIAFIKSLIRENNKHKLWAAEWALDHLVPFKIAKKGGLSVISYESIISEPEALLNFLTAYLELDRPDIIKNELSKPSASTSFKSLKKIRTSNPEHLLSGWRKEISNQEESKLFDIIKKLGVNLYQPGSDHINAMYRYKARDFA